MALELQELCSPCEPRAVSDFSTENSVAILAHVNEDRSQSMQRYLRDAAAETNPLFEAATEALFRVIEICTEAKRGGQGVVGQHGIYSVSVFASSRS